jgi:6-phosphogluconolactonase
VTRPVEIFPDAESLALRAGALIEHAAAGAIEARGVARIALSGGSTPRRTYEILGSRRSLARPGVELYFVDERCVPPDDRASNYRLVASTIGDAGNVYRIRGEDDPDVVATEYEGLLRERFGDAAPAFDLLVLGVGADGHTASLFPEAPELAVRDRWAVATRQPHGWVRRVTVTLPVLNAARDAVMMATGADKARAVADVIAGGASPAARVLGARLLVDDAAAGAPPPRPERPRPDELLDTTEES